MIQKKQETNQDSRNINMTQEEREIEKENLNKMLKEFEITPPAPSKANLLEGALLFCSRGTSPSLFLVSPHGVEVTGKNRAIMSDCVPFENILPFGTCNKRVPPPCVPDIVGQWMAVNESDKIADTSTLTKSSCLICSYGGIIEPITSGEGMASPGESTTPEVMQKFYDSNKLGEHTNETMKEYARMIYGLSIYDTDQFPSYYMGSFFTYNMFKSPYDGNIHRGIDTCYLGTGNKVYNIVDGKIIALKKGYINQFKMDSYSLVEVLITNPLNPSEQLVVEYLHLDLDEKLAKAIPDSAGTGLHILSKEEQIPIHAGDAIGQQSNRTIGGRPHTHIEISRTEGEAYAGPVSPSMTENEKNNMPEIETDKTYNLEDPLKYFDYFYDKSKDKYE